MLPLNKSEWDMPDIEIQEPPAWTYKATARILRLSLESNSSTGAFRQAIKSIIAIPELGLLDMAAGYLAGQQTNSLRLVYQHNIDWQTIESEFNFNEGQDFVEKYETRGQKRYRFILRSSDGDVLGLSKFATLSINPLSDENIVFIKSLLNDVAILIEKRRVDSINSQLAELAGVSPNEMYLIDAETLTIFQANHATQIKTGYRPDQILGKSSTFFKKGMTKEDYRNLVQPLLDGTQDVVTFEGVQKRRDGTTYEASYRVWRLGSPDGIILNEVVEDDTDHKQVLRLLQATFNSFPGGICVIDSTLQLVIANHKLYELMDIPENEFPVGSTYENMLRYMALRGDYGEGDPEEQVEKRISHARLFLEHSFERLRADGTILEVSASPLPGGGSVITYMDVTVRRRAEQELIRHRDQLEEAVRSRTVELEEKSRQLADALEHERRVNALQRQFVSMASHEFRTPLAIIDGAAQRILRRKAQVDATFLEEKSKQIRTAVSRVVELMESILSSGRLEEGRIAIKPGECSIRQVLAESCAKRAEIATNHNIRLDAGNLPETIIADKSAIEQIFTNLLSNAVKYSPNAPDIDVHGRLEGDCAVISVSDHGIGIDKDDLPFMFERYFRARTSTGIAGTGIGLNLVKQIAEMHGGNITLESKAGQGSTFTVSLPVGGPEMSQPENKDSQAA